MAYDEGLAQRIRETLVEQDGVVEKKMFGGLAFMVHGHMCCGVINEEMMVRVGPDQYEEALEQPHAREMDFTGRPMRGMVTVDGDGFETEGDLVGWVERGLRFVTALPPK
ncbi:MAG: TfoX/Sxy family protein [Chloroflexota bacterium]